MTAGSRWRPEGVGSVFRIRLPRCTARSPRPPPRGPARQRRSKATVLLVEDEANVSEFAAAVLQQDGYTLLQAKSGENAKEVWRWHSARIDLLTYRRCPARGAVGAGRWAALPRAEKPLPEGHPHHGLQPRDPGDHKGGEAPARAEQALHPALPAAGGARGARLRRGAR